MVQTACLLSPSLSRLRLLHGVWPSPALTHWALPFFSLAATSPVQVPPPSGLQLSGASGAFLIPTKEDHMVPVTHTAAASHARGRTQGLSLGCGLQCPQVLQPPNRASRGKKPVFLPILHLNLPAPNSMRSGRVQLLQPIPSFLRLVHQVSAFPFSHILQGSKKAFPSVCQPLQPVQTPCRGPLSLHLSLGHRNLPCATRAQLHPTTSGISSLTRPLLCPQSSQV